jgi:2-polyprenyl-6-methoxyphenol hydroxylase-like FAD-dependent oxidoreductase
MNDKFFDVVIVGAGPAGASAALLLAEAGCAVALVERSNHAHPGTGETLPPESRPLLNRLGVWKSFLSSGHLESPGTLSAWGTPEPLVRDSIYNPYGCGWSIDRPKFDEMLVRHAARRGVRVYRGLRFFDLAKTTTKAWQISISKGSHCDVLSSWFLADASGRSCVVSKGLGYRRFRMDRLVGVCRYF